MKPTYYTYGVIIILVIVIAFLIGRGQGPTEPAQNIPEETGTNVHLQNNGAYAIPNSQSSPKSTPTPTQSATKTSGTVAKPMATPSQLPTYIDISTTKDILVANPPQNTTITSPITVTGQATGSWFYEAVFPIYLYDASNRLIAQGQVRALNDWQTTDMVPFMGTLAFPRQLSGSHGKLILRNSNPSGLIQNAKAVQMTVTF